MPKIPEGMPSPRSDVIKLLSAAGFPANSIRRLTGWRLTPRSFRSHLRRPEPTLEERLDWSTTPGQRIATANLWLMTDRLLGLTPPRIAEELASMRFSNATQRSRIAAHVVSCGHQSRIEGDGDGSPPDRKLAEYHVLAVLIPDLLPPHPLPVGETTNVPENSPYNRSEVTRHRSRWRRPRKGERWFGERDGAPPPRQHATENQIARAGYDAHERALVERFAYDNPGRTDDHSRSVLVMCATQAPGRYPHPFGDDPPSITEDDPAECLTTL